MIGGEVRDRLANVLVLWKPAVRRERAFRGQAPDRSVWP
jgi:hypothetical protein